jgi:hypothetical protein
MDLECIIGVGKPMVFWSWVWQVWVWCWTLLHHNVPPTHTCSLQVFHVFLPSTYSAFYSTFQLRFDRSTVQKPEYIQGDCHRMGRGNNTWHKHKVTNMSIYHNHRHVWCRWCITSLSCSRHIQVHQCQGSRAVGCVLHTAFSARDVLTLRKWDGTCAFVRYSISLAWALAMHSKLTLSPTFLLNEFSCSSSCSCTLSLMWHS